MAKRLAQEKPTEKKVVAVAVAQPAVLPTLPLVEWKNERLSVSCVQSSLKEILHEVSAKTGFSVRGLENTQGQISADFEQLPILDGLNLLLKRYNYVALGDLTLKSQEAPVIVVVGPIEGGTASVTNIAQSPSGSHESLAVSSDAGKTEPSSGAGNVAAIGGLGFVPASPTTALKPSEITELVRAQQFSELEAAALKGNEERLADAVSSSDPALQMRAFDLLTNLDPNAAGDAALTAVRQAQTASSRLQALQLLDGSHVQQTELVDALSTAAKDNDSEVRNFAILALGRHGGDLGLSALSDLLRSSDPSIRLLVLQSAAQTSSGRVIISQAMEDSDAGVRDLAAELLNRMPEQQ